MSLEPAESVVDGRPPQLLLGAEALINQVVADTQLPVQRAEGHAVVADGGEHAQRPLQDLFFRHRLRGLWTSAWPLRLHSTGHLPDYARSSSNIYIDT